MIVDGVGDLGLYMCEAMLNNSDFDAVVLIRDVSQYFCQEFVVYFFNEILIPITYSVRVISYLDYVDSEKRTVQYHSSTEIVS